MDAHLSVAAESRDRLQLGLAVIPVVAGESHTLSLKDKEGRKLSHIAEV